MTRVATSTASVSPVFKDNNYVARKKLFKFLGQAFHIYDSQQQLVAFVKMKAFKLKEDIRIYTDDSMGTELISIQARQIIDFSAAYDVYDTRAGVKVGALQRKGLKSMLKDEWVIMNARDQQIGIITEDSMIKAIFRRFIEIASLLMPQRYHAEVGGELVCTLQQNYNIFVPKLAIDFSFDPQQTLDRRLGIAAAVLLMAIEGRQN